MNTIGSFNDLPLSDGMKHTIKSVGFKVPTPIQEQSIPHLLLGKDVLGQAQTGTGKTGAFSIPLVEIVDETKSEIQALVICPTRELCLQVCQEVKRLSEHKVGLESVALYGGQAIDQQFRLLKDKRPQIIVATPGRFFDHLRRGKIELDQVKIIVLDEADEMLDMGFRPEIEQIFDLLPNDNQRVFFSATMPKAIKDLACTYLRNPEIIKIETKVLSASTISQNYFRVRGREKTELLCRMLDYKEPKLALVFCNTKSAADEIAEEIKNRGFETGVLHGDLNQNQRDRVMARFRAGTLKVLVATDVAARGLDIEDVEMVFNYHLPHDPEDYVHRIGRTGRAGRQGVAFSLVEPRDNSRLRRIAHFARVEIAESSPPTLAEVKNAKLRNLFSRVKSVMSSDNLSEYRAFIANQKMSSEDFAAGMIHLAMMKFESNNKLDTAFDELRTIKYTGDSAERKREERSEHFRPRVKRGGGAHDIGRDSSSPRSFRERKRPAKQDEFKSDFSSKRSERKYFRERPEVGAKRQIRGESTGNHKPQNAQREERGGKGFSRGKEGFEFGKAKADRKFVRAHAENPRAFEEKRGLGKQSRRAETFPGKKGKNKS